MRHWIRSFAILAAFAAAACSDSTPVGPIQPPMMSAAAQPARQIVVMSRNMYVGANGDAVVIALASGGDVVRALQEQLAILQRTDFATRIAGLADEIARNRPYVLGLQEAYVLDVNLAALGMGSGSVHLDFLGALQAALAARGLNYIVAARSTLTDVNLAGGAVRLVDHDALLIDPAHVTTTGSAIVNTFAYNLPSVAGITFLRGYVAQPAIVEGVPTLLVNSHAESGSNPGLAELREAQATELAALTHGVEHVILTGDLNDIPGSKLYNVLAGAGLTDVWAAMRPGVVGFTCCNLPDLSNHSPTFGQRIDYVWVRGFGGPSGGLQGQVTLTSDTPAGLLAGAFGSIWPSDHAGVVATILLPAMIAR